MYKRYLIYENYQYTYDREIIDNYYKLTNGANYFKYSI